MFIVNLCGSLGYTELHRPARQGKAQLARRDGELHGVFLRLLEVFPRKFNIVATLPRGEELLCALC